MYSLVENFDSIQGEGLYAGSLCFFLRLGGCDIGCHWCDEKKSWDESKHPTTSLIDIVNLVSKSPSEIVIVTGGEPLMHNLDKLSSELKKYKKVHLETSGAYRLSGNWDWITLSPKKNKLPLPEIYKKTDELKCIIYNQSDFDFAIEQSKKVSENCLLYLQPEWGKKTQIIDNIINFIKKHPRFKLSVQKHKYLGLQ
tara:strand:- start:1181 stop:1771 length:591 start_codon:yes stop_codon:yes gene_type:complete